MSVSFSKTALFATLIVWCVPAFAGSTSSSKSFSTESAGGVKLRKTQEKRYINRDMLHSQAKESHCGPDPEIVAAQEEVKPWLVRLRERIENDKHFDAFQNLLLKSLENGGQLSCVLSLDEQGQNISDFQSFLYASNSGLIRQSQDSLEAPQEFSQAAKEILSEITPFESPPNGLPAANGIHIDFIRKGTEIVIASRLSPRKLKTNRLTH